MREAPQTPETLKPELARRANAASFVGSEIPRLFSEPRWSGEIGTPFDRQARMGQAATQDLRQSIITAGHQDKAEQFSVSFSSKDGKISYTIQTPKTTFEGNYTDIFARIAQTGAIADSDYNPLVQLYNGLRIEINTLAKRESHTYESLSYLQELAATFGNLHQIFAGDQRLARLAEAHAAEVAAILAQSLAKPIQKTPISPEVVIPTASLEKIRAAEIAKCTSLGELEGKLEEYYSHQISLTQTGLESGQALEIILPGPIAKVIASGDYDPSLKNQNLTRPTILIWRDPGGQMHVSTWRGEERYTQNFSNDQVTGSRIYVGREGARSPIEETILVDNSCRQTSRDHMAIQIDQTGVPILIFDSSLSAVSDTSQKTEYRFIPQAAVQRWIALAQEYRAKAPVVRPESAKAAPPLSPISVAVAPFRSPQPSPAAAGPPLSPIRVVPESVPPASPLPTGEKRLAKPNEHLYLSATPTKDGIVWGESNNRPVLNLADQSIRVFIDGVEEQAERREESGFEGTVIRIGQRVRLVFPNGREKEFVLRGFKEKKGTGGKKEVIGDVFE